jgi:DNA-binding transcriptional regulator YbjK
MVQTRRLGAENSKQRSVVIDAAEAILCDEGYAGISARDVAMRAGLTKQNFFYYFGTMDDLILAVVPGNPEMDPGATCRVALHRTGQAAAEWLR